MRSPPTSPRHLGSWQPDLIAGLATLHPAGLSHGRPADGFAEISSHSGTARRRNAPPSPSATRSRPLDVLRSGKVGTWAAGPRWPAAEMAASVINGVVHDLDRSRHQPGNVRRGADRPTSATTETSLWIFGRNLPRARIHHDAVNPPTRMCRQRTNFGTRILFQNSTYWLLGCVATIRASLIVESFLVASSPP